MSISRPDTLQKKLFTLSGTKLIILITLIFTLCSCGSDDNASLVNFAVLSDIHISAGGIDTDGHLYSRSETIFLDAVNEINDDDSIKFVLISGDVTKDGLLTDHEAFRTIVSQVNAPVYLIPGNHDVEHPGKESAEYLKKADFPSFYSGFGYAGGGTTYYSATVYDGVLLISLDSTVYAPGGGVVEDFGGKIDAEQLRWLETVLSENRDKKVILMLHHNVNEHVYNQATEDQLRDFYLYNSAELKAILNNHDVSVVFSGHSHLVDIKEEDGIYDIVTTSLIMYPLGYRVCTIKERSMSVRSRALVTDDIGGVPANDHAYTELSTYMVTTFYDILTQQPYSYAPITANLIAANASIPALNVFNGDERGEGTENIPDEFLPYFIDSPPADNFAEIPF
jgi:3',5'-cyclic AMP phosphodiesterase CpdA